MKITREEMKWCATFCLVTIAITSAPYLLAYFSGGDAWVFTGFVFGVEDGNSYIAKMLLGASGDWLFRTPYTSLDQSGMIAFLPYILLGKLSAAPALHEQLVVWFHIFRCAGIAAYVLAVYQFLTLFIEKISLRKLGTVVITLGGGLGWLILGGIKGVWQNDLPLEFYSPETFGFLSIFGLPHLAFARALLLLGLREYLLGMETPLGWKRGVKFGLYWLLLGLFQPLTVVTGWVVVFAHLALTGLQSALKNQWAGIKTRVVNLARVLLPGAILSGILVIYNFLVFQTDPVYHVWQQQNRIFSPPLLDYLLAFGWVLGFAIAASWKILKEREQSRSILIAWLLIFPVLAYAPYNLQRRLPEGIWVALVALTMIWVQNQPIKTQRGMTALYVQSLLPAIILISGSLINVSNPGLPLFRSSDQAAAFERLAAISPKNAVVLAQFNTSNALPAWAPVHVITGHGPEGIHVENIQPRVEAFFSSNTNPESKIDLLREFGVEYVFVGPDEVGSDKIYYLDSLPLTLIYSKNGYSIYQVDEGLN